MASPPPPLPPTMRAWTFASPTGPVESALRLDRAAPLPRAAGRLGRDELLVRVHAAALNPIDHKLPELPVVGRLMRRRRHVPALDFAGTVVACAGPGRGAGDNDDDFAPGRRVVGRLAAAARCGALADYVVAHRGGVALLPEEKAERGREEEEEEAEEAEEEEEKAAVSLVDAACLATVGLTAYQSIVPHVRAGGSGGGGGSNVLINGGSGGTGVMGIQVAKARGCRVTTTCSTRNVDLCRRLGADEVIDYTAGDVVAELRRRHGGGGHGSGFDLVVDNVGTLPALYWECAAFTAPGAAFCQVGAEFGFRSALDLVKRVLYPRWLGGPGRKLVVVSCRNDAHQLAQLVRWAAEGKLRTVKEEVFDFEDVPNAFVRLKSGKINGKVAVSVNDDDASRVG